MLIKQIVNSKKNKNILTTTSNTTVKDAIEVLSEKRIGVLVVSNTTGAVDGIISERDIVRELGKQGQGTLNLTVGDIMTKKPISCGMDDNAQNVLSTMTNGRFRHMPVIEDNTLIGLITLGDVVQARLNEIETENNQMVEMIRG